MNNIIKNNLDVLIENINIYQDRVQKKLINNNYRPDNISTENVFIMTEFSKSIEKLEKQYMDIEYIVKGKEEENSSDFLYTKNFFESFFKTSCKDFIDSKKNYETVLPFSRHC